MSSGLDPTTKVLLVEDNPLDIRLMRYAFDRYKEWPTTLSIAQDGEQAIHLLDRSQTEGDKPDFVILDLNLPKRDGAEVLQWIRSSQHLRNLPVAVVSTSPLDVMEDRFNNRSVRANGYFVKPMDVDSFLDLTKDLRSCYEQAVKFV